MGSANPTFDNVPISGYSHFTKYIGNGSSNGTFIQTNFRSNWFLTKRIDSTGDWRIRDVKREPFNPNDMPLSTNNGNAEQTSDNDWDVNSNGLKLRASGSGENASGGEYILMAFGQPIISNSGIPATAR